MTTLDVGELQAAAQQLVKSDKGRDAMRRVLDWLENSGLGLDVHNQVAILTLLAGAWGSYAGTTREIMHEALDSVSSASEREA